MLKRFDIPGDPVPLWLTRLGYPYSEQGSVRTSRLHSRQAGWRNSKFPPDKQVYHSPDGVWLRSFDTYRLKKLLRSTRL